MQAADQLSVGIVIRTKDRPIFVTRALASVVAQSYQNWHIMLVNDGGDAPTLADAIAPLMRNLKANQRMTVLDLTPGQGRSAAFNRGVEVLQTDFVACLDDDDTWDPEFLSALMAFFDATKATVPALAGVASQVTALKEDFVDTASGREIRVIGEEGLPPSFRRNEFFLNPLAYACYRQDIYPVQWVLRRDAVLAVGGFPEHFDVMEDRAFMNLFLARYRLAILDRKLAYHHRRVARASDVSRNVLLNSLDNPSYDWRLFADLARPGYDLKSASDSAAALRSIAADLLGELNYETSAIWQKVDGDIRALTHRLDSDKAEMQAALTALMTEFLNMTHKPEEPATIKSARFPESLNPPALFDLWQVFGGAEHAQQVTAGIPFAERLDLSRTAPCEGLLLHVSPGLHRLELQIADTREWSAVELRLGGLAPPQRGLRVAFQLSTKDAYLFETALVCQIQDATPDARFQFSAYEVHACSDTSGCIVTRQIDPAWLALAVQPKLSIILPRHASNFRFICNNLRVEVL